VACTSCALCMSGRAVLDCIRHSRHDSTAATMRLQPDYLSRKRHELNSSPVEPLNLHGSPSHDVTFADLYTSTSILTREQLPPAACVPAPRRIITPLPQIWIVQGPCCNPAANGHQRWRHPKHPKYVLKEQREAARFWRGDGGV
jgi:hypothetical protein